MWEPHVFWKQQSDKTFGSPSVLTICYSDVLTNLSLRFLSVKWIWIAPKWWLSGYNKFNHKKKWAVLLLWSWWKSLFFTWANCHRKHKHEHSEIILYGMHRKWSWNISQWLWGSLSLIPLHKTLWNIENYPFEAPLFNFTKVGHNLVYSHVAQGCLSQDLMRIASLNTIQFNYSLVFSITSGNKFT